MAGAGCSLVGRLITSRTTALPEPGLGGLRGGWGGGGGKGTSWEMGHSAGARGLGAQLGDGWERKAVV